MFNWNHLQYKAATNSKKNETPDPLGNFQQFLEKTTNKNSGGKIFWASNRQHLTVIWS